MKPEVQTNKSTFAHEIHYLLDQQIQHHRALIGLLEEEYAHMGSMDIVGLTEAANAKELIVQEIYQKEMLRQSLTELFSKQHPEITVRSSLKDLAAKLDNVSAERLLQQRSVLTILMDRSKELNNRNKTFAEGSLERIGEMKNNVLGTNNNNKENYSQNGNRQPITEQGGRLLSTEA